MELKPGYKLTDVGVIPDDWMVRSLGALATTVASGKSKVSGGFGNFAVHGSTGVIGYCNFPEYAGDAILVARVGANAGKLNLVSGQYGVTDNTIIVRLSSDSCLPFFWRQLESKRLNSLVFGSGQPLITGTQLKALSLSVPPPAEQRAIAGALSDVDALIGALDQLLAKKRDLKQAAMQQLLTGHQRLPGFAPANPRFQQTELGMRPADWDVRPLGEVVEFLDGRRRPVKDSDRAQMRGDFPYYGASGIVDFVNDFLFDEKLILLGEDGENILSRNCPLAFRVSGKIWVNNHAHVLRPRSGFDIGYLTEYLESLDYEQYNTGTAQPKLNKAVCSALPVVCPLVAEQTAIAEVLSDMDAELAALEQKRDKTRLLKQGMMQELLTGRTRLI